MQNFESEHYALSRMIGHRDAAMDGVAYLTSEDFTDLRHKEIFAAVSECLRNNHEADILNVATTMKNGGSTEQNILYLEKLSGMAAQTGKSITKYVNDLKRATRLRRLEMASNSILEMVKDSEISTDEIIGKVYEDLMLISNDSADKTSFTLDEEFKNFRGTGKTFLEYLEARQEDFKNGIIRLEGPPMGYSQLDDCLKGMAPGHFNLICARPGCGKSTFCLNILLKLMEKNQPLTVFSLEMKLDQILSKLACIKTGISWSDLMYGGLTEHQFRDVAYATQQLMEKDVQWELRGTLSVNQVCNRIKQDSRNRGVKVFFIDYFSRLTGGKRFNSRQEEMQYISTRLAECAKTENVCIMCVAQLNRESVKGASRPPRESDIGESGQLERDAVNIILLHYPSKEDPMDKPGVIIAKVVKARFGPIKDIHYHFDSPCGIFTEMPPLKEEDQKKNYIHAQMESEDDDAFEAFTP